LDIHEYQAKELLRAHGVATAREQLAGSSEEARALAVAYGGRLVLKAQIHAGGRGRAGGVKIAETPDEAARIWSQMMGMTLVTSQTGPAGRRVRRILAAEPVATARAFYLGLTVDRSIGRVVLAASAEGGVEIEEATRSSPGSVWRAEIDPMVGCTPQMAEVLGRGLGLDAGLVETWKAMVVRLYGLFIEKDCSLLEINPLVQTPEGALIALDAKMSFDDNALIRQPEIQCLRDASDDVPQEIEASRLGMSLVKLEGEIGCMVNGAGLAMATMDLIQLCGGRPANFLDVGGGASEDAVRHAFRLLLQDAAVKVILVNIFGGIMRCDAVAAGIVNALRESGARVPVVVRLDGTNRAEGRRILRESGLELVVAETFQEAAERAVSLTTERMRQSPGGTP